MGVAGHMSHFHELHDAKLSSILAFLKSKEIIENASVKYDGQNLMMTYDAGHKCIVFAANQQQKKNPLNLKDFTCWNKNRNIPHELVETFNNACEALSEVFENISHNQMIKTFGTKQVVFLNMEVLDSKKKNIISYKTDRVQCHGLEIFVPSARYRDILSDTKTQNKPEYVNVTWADYELISFYAHFFPDIRGSLKYYFGERYLRNIEQLRESYSNLMNAVTKVSSKKMLVKSKDLIYNKEAIQIDYRIFKDNFAKLIHSINEKINPDVRGVFRKLSFESTMSEFNRYNLIYNILDVKVDKTNVKLVEDLSYLVVFKNASSLIRESVKLRLGRNPFTKSKTRLQEYSKLTESGLIDIKSSKNLTILLNQSCGISKHVFSKITHNIIKDSLGECNSSLKESMIILIDMLLTMEYISNPVKILQEIAVFTQHHDSICNDFVLNRVTEKVLQKHARVALAQFKRHIINNDVIINYEGYATRYKSGNVKMTGYFAAVNQILGLSGWYLKDILIENDPALTENLKRIIRKGEKSKIQQIFSAQSQGAIRDIINDTQRIPSYLPIY